MSTGDSIEQQEQKRENEQLKVKGHRAGKEKQYNIDKKLDGENRPAE